MNIGGQRHGYSKRDSDKIPEQKPFNRGLLLEKRATSRYLINTSREEGFRSLAIAEVKWSKPITDEEETYLTTANFVEKLEAKGITKFIAYEAEVEEVKKKCGKHFEVIMKDLHQTDDLRVLDYDGHRVFRNFTLSKLGQPMYHEP
jgi:hypothetical protein